ncbi:uncharacterized protein CELE_Y9C9A.13 [Caenorhabditis elegans]|uniref:Uncharacterized protein n=1 Tax=Caenorhabditis elegans TaxID=6239 RepID=Q9N2S4_CAEEL|nr:Uncharacterized protein CELE_Y9C9A.13 [Caenorhabditis elegans]CCD68697.2 Uncharacterized protein CELE_Y9C9A.13 [Caenorhabditis elegans]
MDVPSLEDIAFPIVLENFQNGTYNDFETHLDLQSSNIIFASLLSKRSSEVVKFFPKISKNFFLTKVNLKNVRLTHPMIKLLSEHTLESLALGDQAIRKDYKNDIAQVDEILQIILNKKSANNLRQLDISGSRRFLNGAIKKIGKLLPSLQSLIVCDRLFSGSDFQKLCSSFKNLKSLDISDTGVSSLYGISQLTNLETLAMRNLNICEFGHIFRLSKLEALDLSFTKFDRIPVIMRQYSESRGFIPNLKFLDCSGTDVTFSILDELLQKHEKLKKIVVAETLLENDEVDGVEIMNFATFDSNKKTLNYMTSKKNLDSVIFLLRNFETLFYKIQEISKIESSFSLVKEILKSIEVFSNDSIICSIGLKCIGNILRSSKVTRNEQIYVVRHLLKILNRYLKIFPIHEFIIFKIWEILSLPELIRISHLNTEALCKQIQRYSDHESSQIPFRAFMQILEFHDLENINFMKPLLDLLDFYKINILRNLATIKSVANIEVFHEKENIDFLRKLLIGNINFRVRNGKYIFAELAYNASTILFSITSNCSPHSYAHVESEKIRSELSEIISIIGIHQITANVDAVLSNNFLEKLIILTKSDESILFALLTLQIMLHQKKENEKNVLTKLCFYQKLRQNVQIL